MSNTSGIETAGLQAGDARALQLQLYREIGVSAVAAALAGDLFEAPIVAAVTDRPTLATVVRQKVAA